VRKYQYLIIAGLTIPCTVGAAPVGPEHPGAGIRGEPVQQHFLDITSESGGSESGGNVSIVTTREGRSCVASRRIGIETSDYRAPTGEAVPFDRILRSSASSIQAVAGPAGTSGGMSGDAPGFRIQLKYNLAPGTPAMLATGGQEWDVAAALEPSGDSLWLTGAAAAALAAAFRDGTAATLSARSRDTGRQVSDLLPAPDLAALADCAAGLADAPLPAMPVTSEIRLSFDVEQGDEHIATPEDMRACGMSDQPETLYLGRLRDVGGFVSHTDRVFVAYSPEGEVSQVYISGIFDAGLTGPQSSARISHAADGNLPAAPNRVSGCMGTHTVDICHYPGENGTHHLGPCLDLPMVSSAGVPDADASPWGSALPPGGFAPGTGSIPPGNNNRLTNIPPVLPPVFGGGGGGGGGSNGGGEDPEPPVAPIPLPLPGLLLGGAMLLLAGLRRRSARG